MLNSYKKGIYNEAYTTRKSYNYFLSGSYIEALKEIEKTTLDKMSSLMINNLLLIYVKEGKTDLSFIVDNIKMNNLYYYPLGLAKLNKGEYQEAIYDFEMNSNYILSVLGRGDIDRKKLFKYFKLSRDMYATAICYLKLNKYDEALMNLESALMFINRTDIVKDVRFSILKSMILTKKAEVFFDMNNEKSLDFIAQAYDELDKFDDNARGIAFEKINITAVEAKILNDTDLIETALYYIDKYSEKNEGKNCLTEEEIMFRSSLCKTKNELQEIQAGVVSNDDMKQKVLVAIVAIILSNIYIRFKKDKLKTVSVVSEDLETITDIVPILVEENSNPPVVLKFKGIIGSDFQLEKVLPLYVMHKKYTVVALELNTTESSIKYHMRELRRKNNVEDNSELLKLLD